MLKKNTNVTEQADRNAEGIARALSLLSRTSPALVNTENHALLPSHAPDASRISTALSRLCLKDITDIVFKKIVLDLNTTNFTPTVTTFFNPASPAKKNDFEELGQNPIMGSFQEGTNFPSTGLQHFASLGCRQ